MAITNFQQTIWSKKIKEALDLEKRGMPNSAEQKIKEIFPEK